MSELEISEADGVLTLTLCRPQKKNALTSAMYEGMIGAFTRAEVAAAAVAIAYVERTQIGVRPPLAFGRCASDAPMLPIRRL